MSTTLPTSVARPHPWRFWRAGRCDQPLIEHADDLRALADLDPKLWVAIACPTRGLAIDEATLRAIDTDGDGRAQRPEVLAAVQWVGQRLRDPGLVLQPGDTLPLSALAEDEAGQRLRQAALTLLARAGRPDGEALAVADVADPAQLFPPDLPNGDGVVPPELVKADDPALAAWIERLLADDGHATDRSGAPGITQAQLDAVDADVRAVLAWHEAQPEGDPAVLQAAWEAVQAVADKVDDHFARCRLVAFDARLQASLDWVPDVLAPAAGERLDASALAALPLARVTAQVALPLAPDAVNPAWAPALQALREQAVIPLLGARDALSPTDWAALRERVQPWGDWLAARPATPAAAWTVEALRAWVDGGVADRLRAAVVRDEQAAPLADDLLDLRRLLLLRRDLATLLRNFVNFADFYQTAWAAFQVGTLFIDQRECRLCLPVVDAAAHAQLAGYSGMFLLYGQCERAGEAPMGIVAALTAGDASDFLVPGRHGLFVDRQGRPWHFTLQRVVENPISVREAFWLPYRRVVRLIGEQVRKWATAREQAVQEQVAERARGAAATPAGAPTPKPSAGQQAFDIAKFAGVFAAIGLALGAIGTALVALVSSFLQLAWWQMPLVVLGVILLISGPSMLLAALKLRQRNLGPLLDANGWAVNARARVGIAFGKRLTRVAALPTGASRTMR